MAGLPVLERRKQQQMLSLTLRDAQYCPVLFKRTFIFARHCFEVQQMICLFWIGSKNASGPWKPHIQAVPFVLLQTSVSLK
jgi:hypothetical protein